MPTSVSGRVLPQRPNPQPSYTTQAHQRLQQVVGQRHATGHGEQPPQTRHDAGIDAPDDRQRVEQHQRCTSDRAREDDGDARANLVVEAATQSPPHRTGGQGQCQRRPLGSPQRPAQLGRPLDPATPADREADQDAGRHLDEECRHVEEAHRRRIGPLEDTQVLADGVEQTAVTECGVVRLGQLREPELRHHDRLVREEMTGDQIGHCRIDETEGEEQQEDPVGHASHGQQQQAQHAVGDEHVAHPEVRGVDHRDRQQHAEAAQVDPVGARRVGCLETAQLQAEADAEHHAEEQVELAGEEQLAQQGHRAVEAAVLRWQGHEQRVAEGLHVDDEDAEQRDTAQHVERRDALAARQRCAAGVVGSARIARWARSVAVADCRRRHGEHGSSPDPQRAMDRGCS